MSVRGIDPQIMINRAIERTSDQVKQVRAEEQNQAILASNQTKALDEKQIRPNAATSVDSPSIHLDERTDEQRRENKRRRNSDLEDYGEDSKEDNDLLLRPIKNPKIRPQRSSFDLSI